MKLINGEAAVDGGLMMAKMLGDEYKARRRISTSLSAGHGPAALACRHNSDGVDHDKATVASNALRLRWSRLSTVLVLASLVLFALYVSAGRWRSTRLDVGDLVGTSGDAHGMASLGLVLHPEKHRSRDAGIINLHWTITSEFRAPDGVKKRVYLINGQFPGPTIEARSGDTLIVHVENALDAPDDGVSIHWHGLFMRGHNNMDGAVGFTQCAIPPGRNFTYKFLISDDQHGTFWYHAHSQVQRGDGLYGGLVIHRPESSAVSEAERYGYRNEVLLLVGDWYHRSAKEMLAWYTSVGAVGNEPVPDSLVINGHGAFNCAMAVPARPIDCTKSNAESLPSIFRDNPALTRLRLVNTGSIAGLTVGISHAKMTPLQVDGGFEILGAAADYIGILYPGERVDILIEWDSQVLTTGSELEIIMDPENLNYVNPSLTPNQTFHIFPPFEALSPSSIPSLTLPPPAIATSALAPQHFDLQGATSRDDASNQVPEQADHIILLYTKTQKLAKFSNHPMGFINRTSWHPQTPPLLSLPRSLWDEHQLVPHIPLPPRDPNTNTTTPGPWIDLIINNLDDGSHPFHLHGHSFYVVAAHRSVRGWGSYSPWSAAASNACPEFNVRDPLRRDTVRVPRRGFVVLRFRAENEGLWMLHCHVLVHLGSGMAMGLAVGGGGEGEGEGDGGWVVDEGAGALCF